MSIFSSIYAELVAALADSQVNNNTKLAVLDLWNLDFCKSEKFLVDSGLVPTLISLHKLPTPEKKDLSGNILVCELIS